MSLNLRNGAFAALLILASCKAPVYTIGMSQKEFLAHTRADLVKETVTTAIYRKSIQPFGAPMKTKFYYFRDGKLVQIDEGVQRPDILVEHKN